LYVLNIFSKFLYNNVRYQFLEITMDVKDCGSSPPSVASSHTLLAELSKWASLSLSVFESLPESHQMDGLDVLQDLVNKAVLKITNGRFVFSFWSITDLYTCSLVISLDVQTNSQFIFINFVNCRVDFKHGSRLNILLRFDDTN